MQYNDIQCNTVIYNAIQCHPNHHPTHIICPADDGLWQNKVTMDIFFIIFILKLFFCTFLYVEVVLVNIICGVLSGRDAKLFSFELINKLAREVSSIYRLNFSKLLLLPKIATQLFSETAYLLAEERHCQSKRT